MSDKYRGQGIATGLLNKSVTISKSKGACYAHLLVHKDDKSVAARTLYEKLGFEREKKTSSGMFQYILNYR